jgi:16S rRNA (adenine1518-N6/adenine1519-N6)-dimethyltransferase
MKQQARKRFGQNFLVDDALITRIIQTIGPQPGELIIEIGPGREALTGPLLASAADLVVVEIDRDLVARLAERHPQLEVVCADALRVDFPALAAGRPYRLVGNLPYNISTPLMFHLLAQAPAPVDMHFMLQKEVVQRLVAGPGGKDYGRLSLMAQNLASIESLLAVPPEAFEPRPRVDSAVVRLRPRPQPLVPQQFQAAFSELVARAFTMRRKTIRNGLRELLSVQQIEAAGVDPGSRPEQLGLDEFLLLARQR